MPNSHALRHQKQPHLSIYQRSLQEKAPGARPQAATTAQYTAYVDLDQPWHLTLEDQMLHVDVPSIQFNRPNIDVWKIEWTVEEGSLLRAGRP